MCSCLNDVAHACARTYIHTSFWPWAFRAWRPVDKHPPPASPTPPSGGSLLEFFDFAKSAAATGLASTQGGGSGKGVIGTKLAREVVVQLFKKWVESDDRTKVKKLCCM